MVHLLVDVPQITTSDQQEVNRLQTPEFFPQRNAPSVSDYQPLVYRITIILAIVNVQDICEQIFYSIVTTALQPIP